MNDPENIQAVKWRTFSIFVSSTFADMQSERDYLKNYVLPQLDETLRPLKVRLELVDLRWGVDTASVQEDDREATVLQVCIQEIKRCKPFFIGLLGDRYGWVPPAERIAAVNAGERTLFKQVNKSVTALEMEFGILASLEQLNKSLFYFREPLPYDEFLPRKAALFNDQLNSDLTVDARINRIESLNMLKAAIIRHFTDLGQKDKVKPYKALWDKQSQTVIGLEEWGRMVYDDLLNECKKYAEEAQEKLPETWQEEELAILDDFINEHSSVFYGRFGLLDRIKEHLISGSSSKWGLMLTGESGSGKSALIAKIYKELQSEDCFILALSAGLSPRSVRIEDVLHIWNMQLSQFLNINDDSEDLVMAQQLLGSFSEDDMKAPDSFEMLQARFAHRLALASKKKRIVLLLDAIDRLEDTPRAQGLTWLPDVMPGNVRLLCSILSGSESKIVAVNDWLTVCQIDPFSLEEATEVLYTLCRRNHKNISPRIEHAILSLNSVEEIPAYSNPLWLNLAVNVILAIDQTDFEKISMMEGRVGEVIEDYLLGLINGFPSDPGQLFLSLTKKAGMIFGETFTMHTLDFLAVSRNGLRETDLAALVYQWMASHWDKLQFASLRRWFHSYLKIQGEELKWNLYHNAIRMALILVIPSNKLTKIHNAIAQHLINLPEDDTLKSSETMHHFMQGDDLRAFAEYVGSDLDERERTIGIKTLASAIISNRDKKINDPLNKTLSMLSVDGLDDNIIFTMSSKVKGVLRNFSYSRVSS